MKRISTLILFYLVLPMATFAMFQEGGAVDPVNPPYILFAPYLIGIILHWAKKYTLDGLGLNIWQYLTQNFYGTITSVVIGLASLGTMYGSSGHGGLFPVTLASWIAAFWVGVGADTVNSGMTKKQA